MIVLAGAFVLAGDMNVNISRPFKAGGKDYPAGHYRFISNDTDDHIDLLSVDRKTRDEIKISSRLSAKPGKWGEVVFDEVGTGLYLSEIYFVAMDGFYFEGAPGKHKHLIFREEF
jgi:hypothetical protein